MTKSTKKYSKAMERLNEILDNIDRNDVSIDDLADQVVEAADLLKTCKKLLTDTESRVKDVLEGLEGEFGDED